MTGPNTTARRKVTGMTPTNLGHAIESALNPEPFQAEADRNSAVEALVRVANRQGELANFVALRYGSPDFLLPPMEFSRYDHSLTDFAVSLELAANSADARELVAESRQRGVSLSEVVAERFDPANLKLVQSWYIVAGEAVRHNIRLAHPIGNRTRYLAAIPAQLDDARAVRYKTYRREWGESKAARVVWVDAVSRGSLSKVGNLMPLNGGTLEGFLVERAPRVLTTAMFVKYNTGVLAAFRFPRITPDESGEDYFRRIADTLIDAGATKVNIDEMTFPVMENLR